jgi:hypothetical protein
MLAPQRVELGPVDGVRLGRLQRRDGRRADRLRARYERELAERFAGTAEGQERRLAERGGDPDREPAGGDEMEGVRRIALVEDDLATAERPAARDRQHPPNLGVGDVSEELPAHVLSLLPCRGLDTRIVARANDAAAAGT